MYLLRDGCQVRSNSQYILTFKKENKQQKKNLLKMQKEKLKKAFGFIFRRTRHLAFSLNCPTEIRTIGDGEFDRKWGKSSIFFLFSFFFFSLGETTADGQRTCLPLLPWDMSNSFWPCFYLFFLVRQRFALDRYLRAKPMPERGFHVQLFCFLFALFFFSLLSCTHF